MPLARTPPQKGPAPPPKSHREHTFSPSQAFPDGTPLPPEMLQSDNPIHHTPTPATTQARTSGPVPTPWPESHEDMRVPSALKKQGVPGDDEDEMGIDAELESTPKASQQQHKPAHVQPPRGPSPAFVAAVRSPSPPPVPVKLPPVPATPTGRRKSRRQTRDPELLAEEAAASRVEALGEPQPVPVSPQAEEPEKSVEHPHPSETPARKRQRKSQADVGAQPADEENNEQQAPPVTPRRASRGRAVTPARTPAEVLAEPPVPVADAEEAQFGKYYEALVRTLKINAIDRGLSRLTLEQMKECYPLLAAEKPDTLADVWANMLHELRSETLGGATKLLEDYKVGRRLATFADVISEARAWSEEHTEGRVDAWRPDLSPYVISAGTNLEVYDESWSALREEYLELAQECGDRYARVKEKAERLAAMDNGVSEAVVELGKTNDLLKEFPSAEMLEWAEGVDTRE